MSTGVLRELYRGLSRKLASWRRDNCTVTGKPEHRSTNTRCDGTELSRYHPLIYACRGHDKAIRRPAGNLGIWRCVRVRGRSTASAASAVMVLSHVMALSRPFQRTPASSASRSMSVAREMADTENDSACRLAAQRQRLSDGASTGMLATVALPCRKPLPRRSSDPVRRQYLAQLLLSTWRGPQSARRSENRCALRRMRDERSALNRRTSLWERDENRSKPGRVMAT